MKFYYMKTNKMKICRHCGCQILRGEAYILNSHRNKDTDNFYSFPYHYECYISYMADKIRRDALRFLGQMIPPKKLGRPRKYNNPKTANRVKSLISYHRRAGNLDRVKELEEQYANI